MENFSQYNSDLESSFNKLSINSMNQDIPEIISNKRLNENLRSLINIQDLRAAGSFFTGDQLAEKLISQSEKDLNKYNRIYDPACGAGNLLIACSKKLKVFPDLEKTIEYWGSKLYGKDIHEEFVIATKWRLIFEAISRGSKSKESSKKRLLDLLVNITQGDSLLDQKTLIESDLIIMNPPFTYTYSPIEYPLNNGKVNLSAVFLYQVIKNISSKAEVLAILPDVIRSGTRYEKLRNIILNPFKHTITSEGQFDNETNVDVVTLKLQKESIVPDSNINKTKTLSDITSISVGSVVPHRDPLSSKVVPFISAKTTKGDFLIEKPRCFKGYVYKKIQCPFIIINRTSSPSESKRIKVKIVNCKEDVAVENHLIIIRPNDNTLESCKTIASLLQSDYVSDYINQQIRCRHLTTRIIKTIPIKD